MSGIAEIDLCPGTTSRAAAVNESAFVAVAPVERATLDRFLDVLLHHESPPLVMSFAENGLTAPLPAAVPVRPGNHLDGFGSVFEVCVPTDIEVLVTGWERARRLGASQTIVAMRVDPQRAVTLHFIDARHSYGVILGLFMGHEVESGRTAAPALALFRPRLCAMQRDELAIIRSVDGAVTKILGWDATQLIGRRTIEFVHPDDRPAATAAWMEMLARPEIAQRTLVRYLRSDGSYVWFETTHDNRLSDPQMKCVVSQMVDVSDRMDAIEALRANEELLRRLTEALPIGIFQIDAQGQIVHANERLGAIVGSALAGNVVEQFANAEPEDRTLLEATLATLLESGVAADIELTLEGRHGSRRCSMALRALTAENGTITGAIACVTDVTEGVRLREELETRATFDELTRCRNRAAILETLEEALASQAGAPSGVAVVFMDLDRFKEVNDRSGHAAGDELLRRVGERLLAGVRAGDVVGRLGGDEFLIVCPDVASPQAALEIARRIALSIAERTVVGSQTVFPTASIGVAWTLSTLDTDEFVARADAAMYSSKRFASGPVLAA